MASLAIISVTFPEYQISISRSYSKYNAGIDLQDFLVDLSFMPQGPTIHFSAIALGPIIATGSQIPA